MVEQISRLNERVKTRLAPSPLHGVGVFALRDIAKGQKLYADAVPEVYAVRYANFDKLFPEVRELLLERWPGVVSGENFVYPTERVQAFLNHSETPNYSAFNDTLLRDVKAGEELCEDYRLIKGYQQVYKWLLDKEEVV